MIGRAMIWGAAAFLGATWLGYPAVLRLLPRRPITRGPFTGTVTVVCVVRDEAAHIARRIAELRAQTRPPDQIVIVDDGSSDDTVAIASTHDVTLIAQPRLGKSVGLGAGVAASTADVIVFCDVRQHIAADALEHLLRPLADPDVGCVSALLTTPSTQGPGLYWRYETMVRLLETRSGSVVGASGALYAIRRALFVAPPAGLVLDDVWVPMHCARTHRVVLEQDAHVVDVEADVAREAARKLRTLAGNHQLFAAAPWLASRRDNPLYWRTFWHKRARLYAPLALATVAVAALADARRHPILAGAVGAIVGTWAIRKRHPSFAGRLGGIAETLVELNLSAARAWLAARGPIRWR